jgi:siroheme synthase (precorrin-2 oxidase/ferrochelatase)
MMIAGAAEAKHFNDEEDVRARFEQAANRLRAIINVFKEITRSFWLTPALVNMSKEDVIRLKVSYRKASRLCHPDMVAEELKERAAKQFQPCTRPTA